MAEGKDCKAWNVAAAQMALQANCNRGEKQRSFTPSDFHPYLARKRTRDMGDYIAATTAIAEQGEFIRGD